MFDQHSVCLTVGFFSTQKYRALDSVCFYIIWGLLVHFTFAEQYILIKWVGKNMIENDKVISEPGENVYSQLNIEQEMNFYIRIFYLKVKM